MGLTFLPSAGALLLVVTGDLGRRQRPAVNPDIIEQERPRSIDFPICGERWPEEKATAFGYRVVAAAIIEALERPPPLPEAGAG